MIKVKVDFGKSEGTKIYECNTKEYANVVIAAAEGFNLDYEILESSECYVEVHFDDEIKTYGPMDELGALDIVEHAKENCYFAKIYKYVDDEKVSV